MSRDHILQSMELAWYDLHARAVRDKLAMERSAELEYQQRVRATLERQQRDGVGFCVGVTSRNTGTTVEGEPLRTDAVVWVKGVPITGSDYVIRGRYKSAVSYSAAVDTLALHRPDAPEGAQWLLCFPGPESGLLQDAWDLVKAILLDMQDPDMQD